MPAKMRSEIPLPMPRSVICSPTHIMNAVPVVSVSMLMRRKPQPAWVTTSPTAAESDEVPVVHRLEAHRDAEGLDERERDRAVARVLIDLALALLAFLAELVERLEDHRQELKDDARADVRHDAEREDREVRRSAPPLNMLNRPRRPAPCLWMTAFITVRSTPGIVTKTPMR